MIRFASFGENQGKKHIFESGSCQSIVVDLNLRDKLLNVSRGGGYQKLTQNCLPSVIIEENYFQKTTVPIISEPVNIKLFVPKSIWTYGYGDHTSSVKKWPKRTDQLFSIIFHLSNGLHTFLKHKRAGL